MKQYKETSAYLSALKEFKVLAKKADRRLRELERFSRYDEYKNILDYAYRTAKRDIDAWTPPDQHYDKPRFSRNIPMDTRSLKAKIKDIKKFLDKPTSTVTGVKRIYQKRADTLNKEVKKGGYGTQFTWQDLAQFFEQGGLAEKTFKYGSKTVLVAIGKIQKNKKQVLDIMQNIKEGQEVNILIDDDAVVNDTIDKIIRNYDKDVSKLLNN